MGNDSNLPHVAVIITTYNNREYLPYAVRSALEQDYPNCSVVVVDDGSTDNSVETIFAGGLPLAKEETADRTVYEVAAGKKLLTYIKLNKNRGPSYGRNQGIQYAWKSDIFSILDADDQMANNKLSVCVERLFDNGLAAGVYTDYFHFNVEHNTYSYESKYPYSVQELNNQCIIHSGCTFRRSVLEKIGCLYNENLRTCEDYNLWLKISRYYTFEHISLPLHVSRIHNNNSTNYVSKEDWERNYQLCWYDAMAVK